MNDTDRKVLTFNNNYNLYFKIKLPFLFKASYSVIYAVIYEIVVKCI